MSDSKPSVELVMVTWNTKSLVQKTIPDILDNTNYPNLHITIIDNASYDGTWQAVNDICYAYPEKADAIQLHLNKGYGTACNIGAKLTQPDYYVFMNSDIHIHPDHHDWLTKLVDTFDEDEEIGVVAPKLINKENKVVGHAVLGTNRQNDLSWYWMQDDGEEFDDVLEAVTLCGAVIIIPRELFWDMDGFDERFFHYYEEKDIIYRLRQEGYKAICNPQSVVIHDHMGSCQDQNLLSVYEYNGQSLFVAKHNDFLTDPKTYGR